ncbi:MAG: HNH endonuclease [Phycisphaerae bacterium]|nr:HNH endonuclease [Phycisphaerae bacterium]
MPIEKPRRITEPRCDNCSFSTFATGPGRPVLICRQKKGDEGRWKTRPLLQNCPNFHSSRAANPANSTPRLIPLTRGQFAIVDAKDYPALTKFTWFAEGGERTYYAVRKQNGKSIKMHRQITNAPPHLVVDHIDHNGRNNRNANLRLATFTQNCQNQRRVSNKTSRYKGVYWNKRLKKWAAQITANKKTHHLGYHKTEEQAAKTYDAAARKYHGNFASLNFPKNA